MRQVFPYQLHRQLISSSRVVIRFLVLILWGMKKTLKKHGHVQKTSKLLSNGHLIRGHPSGHFWILISPMQSGLQHTYWEDGTEKLTICVQRCPCEMLSVHRCLDNNCTSTDFSKEHLIGQNINGYPRCATCKKWQGGKGESSNRCIVRSIRMVPSHNRSNNIPSTSKSPMYHARDRVGWRNSYGNSPPRLSL